MIAQTEAPLPDALFEPGGPYADHVHKCPFCGFRTAYLNVLEAHFQGSADCDRKRLRETLPAQDRRAGYSEALWGILDDIGNGLFDIRSNDDLKAEIERRLEELGPL